MKTNIDPDKLCNICSFDNDEDKCTYTGNLHCYFKEKRKHSQKSFYYFEE